MPPDQPRHGHFHICPHLAWCLPKWEKRAKEGTAPAPGPLGPLADREGVHVQVSSPETPLGSSLDKNTSAAWQSLSKDTARLSVTRTHTGMSKKVTNPGLQQASGLLLLVLWAWGGV